MSLLTATLCVTLAAGAPEPVLVVSYQSLGVEPSTVTSLLESFRGAVGGEPLAPLPAAESEKATRSAVMCGEDGACLANVGERSSARWVLAFAIGKVGSSLLVSALFVDVAAGKELMRTSRRVPEGGADWPSLARAITDEVVKRPAAPVVVQVPVNVPQPTHRFRPWAFTFLGVTGIGAIAASVLGAAAWSHYGQLKMSSPAEFDALAREQRGINGAADSCLIVALVALVPTVVFFLLDRFERPAQAVAE